MERYMGRRKGIILCALLIFAACLATGCKGENSAELIRKVSEEASTGNDAEVENASEDVETVCTETTQADEICVYVCGAVQSPGVYTLEEGARLFEAISAAGGFAEDACEYIWNQALVLADGQMIYVPSAQEVETGFSQDGRNLWSLLGMEEGSLPESGTDTPEQRININTATAEELTAIPGIGASKAELIVSYRNEYGFFTQIEEIQNVPGIKGATFERIKDYIKVR